jgi:NAD(P)H dehydrogenase (quinone)
MATKVAVIYYSATGNVYKLAQAVEEGAKEAGAEVRFRKVRELAPEEAIRMFSKAAANKYGSDHDR